MKSKKTFAFYKFSFPYSLTAEPGKLPQNVSVKNNLYVKLFLIKITNLWQKNQPGDVLKIPCKNNVFLCFYCRMPDIHKHSLIIKG